MKNYSLTQSKIPTYFKALQVEPKHTTEAKTAAIRKPLFMQRLFWFCFFLVCFSFGLQAQIAQRDVATTNVASGTNISSLTINRPAGVVSGDLLIVSILQNETDNDNGGLSSVIASGWTLVDGRIIRSNGTSDGDNAWHGTILYRVAGASEAASYSFTLPNSRADMAIGSMVAFSGVNTTGGLNADGTSGGPFDVDPGILNLDNSSTTTALSATTVTNNAAALMFSFVNDNTTHTTWSATNPTSLTELFNNETTSADDGSIGAAWAIRSNSGSTGNGLAALSGSDYNAGLFVILKSACPNPNTVSSASSTPTLCVNTPLTNITHTTTGATGIGAATGLPAGVSAAWAANVLTISGTPTASGTFNYSIPLTGGCGAVNATGTITVTAAPNAGTLSGTQNICVAGTTTFTTNGNTGGTWTSGATGVATVNSSTGLVTGVAAGTATITYTVTGTGGCVNATATRTVTVTAAPNAGTLSGTQNICAAGTTTFTTNGNAGGAWTSGATGVATVNSSTGLVTGVAAGTATITYTVTGTSGCVNATATRTVTVTANPTVNVGPGLSAICQNVSSAYRYFIIDVATINGGGDGYVQLSEFNFLNGATPIAGGTWRFWNTSFTGNSASNSIFGPAGEGPENVNDANTATKWLDFRGTGGGLWVDFGSLQTVSGYRWSTANDATWRDMRGWIVYGSTDNVNWSALSTISGFTAPTARFTQAGIWNLALNTTPGLGGGVTLPATGGTWSTPAGGSFIPSATDLNATWTPPSGFSGTATLTLTSSGGTCGTASGSKSITVNPVPTAAGAITGTSSICQGQTGISYAVPTIATATSYQWTYSGTGFTPSGTTASITGSFAANATSGILTVRGVNSCGAGVLSANFPITVNGLPDAPANFTAWVDDALPAGATAIGAEDGWNWISSNPSPQSGTVSHQSALLAGIHQHYFQGATAGLAITANDNLYCWVYLDPANPPSTVMLQWNDGSWEHRAYWGSNNLPWGTNGTNSRRNMGPLPATGQWVRLEVPASQVGLVGSTLNGMAFSLFGGRASWDAAGKFSSTLNGSPSVCQGTNNVAYSVSPVTGATSYVWSYSGAGFTANAPGNTASITANFSASATAGNLTVRGQNACGLGPVSNNFPISLAQSPGAAGTITGVATVCRGQSGFSYTVPAITNATSYNWQYTGTGVTFSGNTQTVTITVSNTATSGLIRVRGVNACLNGNFSADFALTVNNAPTVTISSNYCTTPGVAILTATAGFTSYSWNNGATTSFINADVAGQYSVTVSNGSGCSATASVSVAAELVTNGNFNLGNTGFTTAYSYRADVAGQSEMYPEGTYAVVPNANSVHNLFWGTGRTPGGGPFMVINGHPALGQTVWSQNSIPVQPNTTYYFSAWGLSVVNGNNAVLRFSINGNQVGTTAFLPDGYTNTAGPFNWVRFFGSWNSGFATSVDLSIVNLNTILGGNDFGLDDISFGTLSPVALSAAPSSLLGTTVCEGSEFVLNANANGGASPFTYQWTGPSGFTSSEMNPTVAASASAANAGTYTLTVTDGFGCSVSSNVTIGISTMPLSRTPVASVPTVCAEGNSAITIANSQSGVSYQLRNDADDSPLGDPVAGTGGTISFAVNNLAQTTTYNVLATGNLSQCSIEMPTTVTVTVATTPVLVLTNQAVCSGTVNLTAAAVTAGSTGSGTLSYWTNATGTTALTNPTSVSASGTYFIRSTVGACSDIEPVSVSIGTSINTAFSYTGTQFCSTGADPAATLGVGAVAGAFTSLTPGLVFLSTSSGLVDLSASVPGTYTVRNTVTPVGTCSSVSSTASIVITQAPLTAFSYNVGNDFCQVYNAQNPTPVFAPGAAAGTFSSTFGLNFVNASTGEVNLATSTPGNYAVWNSRNATGGCAARSDTVFIDINPYVFDGAVMSSVSDDNICTGQVISLFSQTSPYNSVLLRERFNGSLNNWVRANNSTPTGGTQPEAAWTLRPDNFNYNAVAHRSNDNTQFYVSNSQAQAGTSTLTTLRSPVMNTVGYTTLNLDFFHFFNTTATGDTARVQVSLNNSTWTTVATYTTVQGSPTGFANPVINLNAYIGQPIFYVRFQYKVSNDRLWAIDNVRLSGVCNKYTYNWTSAPAGYSSTMADPINVTPTQNTFYIVNATNTFGCSNPASPTPVTVNALPVLTSSATPPAVCANEEFNYAPTATPAAVTIDWTRPAVAGVTNPGITAPQIFNPNEILVNITNANINVVYNMRMNNNGCQQVVPVTVAVKPVPTIDVGSNQSVCNGSPAQLNANISNGLNVSTYTWTPSTGLSSANSASPTATVPTASESYSVAVVAANGCSNTSSAVTISNIGFGGTPGLWLGTQSNLWDDCRNWADGKVPDINTNVVIDGTSANNLLINGAQVCNNLTFTSSNSATRNITINPNATLSASGHVNITKSTAGGSLKIQVKNNASLICNNLVLTGSAAGSADAMVQKDEVNSMLIINGDLTLNTGGQLDMNDNNNGTQDGTLNLRGDLTNNANASDLNIGNVTIIFGGNDVQFVTCPTTQDFKNITLDNSSVAGIRLSNNITVSQQLTFINGVLDLNGKTLTLGSATANATLIGSGNNSYIVSWDGADNGTVIQRVSSVGSAYLFPIGDLNEYTPFTVNLTSATLSGATLTAKLVGTPHPSINASSNIYLGRYWSIEPTGITNPLYNVSYSYASSDIFGDESFLFPAKFNSGGWQSCIESMSNAMIGNGSVNAATNTLTWTGITTFSAFTGVGNGNPLPIELLNFTAEPVENEVQLAWTTASETNNSFFTVERSTDGVHFEKVVEQAGAGNSNGIRNYDAVDATPYLGISYYRLKQTDFNGDFTYSDMVPVNFLGENRVALNSIFADRANGTLNIRCSNPANAEIHVELFDANGRLVHRSIEGKANKNWNGTVGISQLSGGSYIARITIAGKLVHGKFIY